MDNKKLKEDFRQAFPDVKLPSEIHEPQNNALLTPLQMIALGIVLFFATASIILMIYVGLMRMP